METKIRIKRSKESLNTRQKNIITTIYKNGLQNNQLHISKSEEDGGRCKTVYQQDKKNRCFYTFSHLKRPFLYN